MRPILFVKATPSVKPSGSPGPGTISGAVRMEIVNRQDALRRDSGHPTIPSPPPAPGLLALARPSGAPRVELVHCREVAPVLTVEAPRRLRSSADILAIYDRVRRGRGEQIRAKGLRLHVLAPNPQLDVEEELVESVVTTLLDVALGASPRGGRVHVVARDQDRDEIVVSFAASWHAGTDELPARVGESVETVPELLTKLEGCRSAVRAAGGDVFIDSDERCTTVRVSFPKGPGRRPLVLFA